jgi:hypothetical protein
MNLIEEGSAARGAFLMLEGECKIFSMVDPAEVQIKTDGTVSKVVNPFAFRTPQLSNSPLK